MNNPSSTADENFGLPELTLEDRAFVANLPRHNHSELKTLIKNELPSTGTKKVSEINYKGTPHIMKTYGLQDASFSRNLVNEIRAYRLLSAKQSQVGPALLAFVHESHNSKRVMGFVMQKFVGRQDIPSDRQACLDNLARLHSCGFVHWDLENMGVNLLITSQGPRFFDFEHARFEQLKAEEKFGFQSLPKK